MNRRLQEFRFNRSHYDRPTQKWVCGWAAEGKACAIGPDHKGRCIATWECTPKRKGDRWMCARPEAFGGRCDAGPLPGGACSRPVPRCRPVLGTRARRGVLSRWASALLFGLLFLFASGDTGRDFLSPGAVTSSHSLVGRRCENCHTTFQGGPRKWIYSAFSSAAGRDDSRLCLNCHNLGDQGRQPHGVSVEMLARVSARVGKRPPSAGVSPAFDLASLLGLNGRQVTQGLLACAGCHREHRGRDFDLRAMDDRRCQACHSYKYEDFGKSHPEFTGFPYVRRTRLIFDHLSHPKEFRGKGLIQKGDPLPCKRCHMSDPSGSAMILKGFQASCSACHKEAKIRAKGIPILTLPGLDVETLREADVKVGEWPEDAQEEEGEITPFMRLLLSADPGFLKVEATLKEVDLLDLSKANLKQKSAAGQFAWAVKGLLYDLTTKGQGGFKSRLRKALGRTLSESEILALIGQMPIEVVRAAQKRWLPNLKSEMAKRRSEKEKPEGEGEAEKGDQEAESAGEVSSDEELTTAGGWYRRDFSLIYRPAGHADRFLRGWLNVSAEGRGASALREIFTALTRRGAPGLCAKCHSIEKIRTKTYQLNWKGKSLTTGVKDFNRFEHAPHLSLLDEKGCLTCHRLNPQAAYLDGFKDTNPMTFASNFAPMPKKLCAKCHTGAAAPDNCLTCHNYHIGKLMPALFNASLQFPGPSR